MTLRISQYPISPQAMGHWQSVSNDWEPRGVALRVLAGQRVHRRRKKFYDVVCTVCGELFRTPDRRDAHLTNEGILKRRDTHGPGPGNVNLGLPVQLGCTALSWDDT